MQDKHKGHDVLCAIYMHSLESRFIQYFNACIFNSNLLQSWMCAFPFGVVMPALKNFPKPEHFQLPIFRLRKLNSYCFE